MNNNNILLQREVDIINRNRQIQVSIWLVFPSNPTPWQKFTDSKNWTDYKWNPYVNQWILINEKWDQWDQWDKWDKWDNVVFLDISTNNIEVLADQDWNNPSLVDKYFIVRLFDWLTEIAIWTVNITWAWITVSNYGLWKKCDITSIGTWDIFVSVDYLWITYSKNIWINRIKQNPFLIYSWIFNSWKTYYNNSKRKDIIKYSWNYYLYKWTDWNSWAWNISNWQIFWNQFYNPTIYDCIVDSDWEWDYTSLPQAIADWNVRIFVKWSHVINISITTPMLFLTWDWLTTIWYAWTWALFNVNTLLECKDIIFTWSLTNNFFEWNWTLNIEKCQFEDFQNWFIFNSNVIWYIRNCIFNWWEIGLYFLNLDSDGKFNIQDNVFRSLDYWIKFEWNNLTNTIIENFAIDNNFFDVLLNWIEFIFTTLYNSKINNNIFYNITLTTNWIALDLAMYNHFIWNNFTWANIDIADINMTLGATSGYNIITNNIGKWFIGNASDIVNNNVIV